MAALTMLLSQSTSSDEDILQAADSHLNGNTTDLDTLRIKAIALLRLDRFDDVYKLFDSIGRTLQEHASLEYAYTCYKTRKPLGKHGNSRAHKHVQAQMEYNMETFEAAKKSFESLLSDGPASERIELEINAAATAAQLQWNGIEQTALSKQNLTSHESYYNAACLSIAGGNLSRAKSQLDKSKDLCRSARELSKEEMEADLLLITLQQVHVLERMGNLDEARDLLSSLSNAEISDPLMKRMASLDAIVLDSTSHGNPYTTAQIVANNHASRPNAPPTFTFQQRLASQNTKVSELLTGHTQHVKQSHARLLGELTTPTCNSLSVLYAAAVANCQTGKKGIKSIEPLLEKRPDEAGLVFLLVQMHAETGDLAGAVTCLETFIRRQEKNGSPAALKCRFQPALVALMTKLYEQRGQNGSMRAELAKAANYWRDISAGALTEPLRNLYRTAGYALLGSSDQKEQTLAAEIFSNLHTQDADRYSTAGLVASDASALATLSSDLDALVAGIDTEALIAAGIAKAPRPALTKSRAKSKSKSKTKTKTKSKASSKTSSQPSTSHRQAQQQQQQQQAPTTSKKRPIDTLSAVAAGRTTTTQSEAASRPAKRVKPSKQPKDYDPAKTPDPERWLPVRERSTYRPAKGGKKKRDAARLRREMASQGTSSANLAVPGVGAGAGAGAGTGSVDSSRPGTPGIVGSSASSTNNNNKKKKGKGKR